MSALLQRYPLACYFLLAYLFTWAIEMPMMLTVRGVIDLHLPHWLEALAAFGPFLAAVIVLRATQPADGVANLLASLVRWRVPPLWLLATFASPFVVLIVALQMTGESAALWSGSICATLTEQGRWFDVLIIGALIRGIGEEPGWRGFATPVLRQRFGPLAATFALWPFWALWHLPSFLMRPEFQLGAFIGFSAGILAATAWSTLLYDKTRSVLMIAIWHALINITRTMAGTSSSESFFAFAQVMLGIGVVIIVYWLIRRPGPWAAGAKA